MTNKNKIINQAQKFITKGQWDKAIKELQKLIAEDPKDVRTLLKLGDVHSKKGDREAATKVYRQVAESYSEQGFFLKAVAVYKQILKHDPKHMEVTFKLAELYEHLGLTNEALGQYQAAAQIHEERGEVKQSLDVLRRMVELDAENVAARIKLAESYSRESMIAEAAGEFEKAADVLKRQNRSDDYIKVAERLVYHAPDRYDVIKELATIYLKRQDAKRALAKLQICFKANPRDVETLTLLAQAFSDLGQFQKTAFVYKELINLYQQTGRGEEAQRISAMVNQLEGQRASFVDNPAAAPSSPEGIFSSYGSLPPDAGAVSLSQAFAPPPPSAADDLLLAPLTPGGAHMNAPRTPMPRSPSIPGPGYNSMPPPRMPGPPPPGSTPRGPSLAPRPRMKEAVDDVLLLDEAVPSSSSGGMPIQRGNTQDSINKILTETDVYIKYGLRDKALEHLRRIFQMDVDNVAAYGKMRDLYLSMGDASRAAESVANMLHVYARRGDGDAVKRARAELKKLAPGHPLASGGLPGGMPHPVSAPLETSDDSISVDISEDSGAFDMVDFAEGGNEDSGSIELDGDEIIAERAASGDLASTDLAFEPPTEYENEAAEGAGAGLSLETDWSAGLPEDEELFEDAAEDNEGSESLAGRTTDDLAFGVPTPGGPTQVPDSLSEGLEIDPALAEADPFATDEELLAQAEIRSPAQARDEVEADPFGGNVVSEVVAAPTAEQLDSGEEEFGFLDDSSEEITGETLAPITGATGAQPLVSSPVDDEEETEFGDDELEEIEPEPDEPEVEDGFEDELEEAQFLVDQGLIDEARDALHTILGHAPNHRAAKALLAQVGEGDGEAAPIVDRTDETPAVNGVAAFPAGGPIDEQAAGDAYDQGMLFMDLGRHADAIKEFETAARAPARAIGALEMIGHCYMQQGRHDTAVEYYALALENGADGHAATNIKYEIGSALEAAGDAAGARRWYQDCARSDPNHRDVAERLAALGPGSESPGNGSYAPGSKSQPPASSSKKISYL